MAKLIFISSDFAGRAYELVLEKTTVGRGDKNTLVIRDGSVSASHCEVLTFGTEVIVRDLDSANGTFVNGARLQGQTQVKSGQILRFGKVEAKLELGPESDDRSEMTAIHEHARLMREQRKAKPTTPAMKLEHVEASESEEQTVLTPRRPAPAPTPTPAAVEPTEAPAGKSSMPKVFVTAAIVILGAILLLWLFLRTK